MHPVLEGWRGNIVCVCVCVFVCAKLKPDRVLEFKQLIEFLSKVGI